jgi:hypothetical protein
MLPTAPPSPDDPQFPAADQAFGRQIRLQRETDAMIGVKTGATLLLRSLIKVLQTDPHGVRAELLVGVPAMLSGFACQAATWESLVVNGRHPVQSVFALVQTDDGTTYPFSDPMNKLLLEDQYSVWGLTLAIGKAKTDQPMPDVLDTVQHVAKSIGSPEFGQPRLPQGLSLGHNSALDIVQHAWPRFLPLLGLCCAIPEEWPVLYAIALQQAIDQAQSVIPPDAAVALAIECAVPMAHLPMLPA